MNLTLISDVEKQMGDDIPVIKLFIYKGNYYMYDFGKNRLLQLSENFFKEIKILQNLGFLEYTKLYKDKSICNDIVALKSQGYFNFITVERILHYNTPYLTALLDRFIHDLVLQVTQDCNFQCRYCLFANDTQVERNHKKINMDFMTAKRSVDFLYDHCVDANEVSIGFYGGEPLLNFDLVEHITEYAKQKFQSKYVRFLTTTNASLLTDNIIRFFINNHFEVSISLDGNEDYQNDHRKYRINGKNTFETVIKNVKKIRDISPEYFRENVSFNPVIFNDENPEKVYAFFESIGVHPDNININKANLNGIDYLDSPTMLFSNQNVDSVRSEIKFSSFEKQIEDTSIVPKHWHPNGQCVPGVRRIFVTVDGSIYPCEKIVENKAFIIGNINNRNDDIINKDTALRLLNSATITQEECKRCWAFRFCEMCISHCLNPSTGCLSKETKLLHCNNQKKHIMEMMKSYIDLCNI